MTAINIKTGIISIICYLTFLNCNAQINTISKNAITLNNNIVLGMSTENFTTLFGIPIATQNEYFEISNKNALVYQYDGGTFWFVDNSLHYFRIYGSAFSVFNNGITVNQNINVTELMFPLSFQNKSNNALIINVLEYDRFITIEYNDFNWITSIEVNSY
jgi:hypothetical protein